MSIRKGKCSNFGNCNLADTRQAIIVENNDDFFLCPECHKSLLLCEKNNNTVFFISFVFFLLLGISIPYLLLGSKKSSAPSAPSAPSASSVLSESSAPIEIKVNADAKIKHPGGIGILNIAIKPELIDIVEDDKKDSKEKNSASKKVYVKDGNSVKIKPFATGMNIEGLMDNCMALDSGIDISLKLIPLNTGIFRVGTNVDFYKSSDCSGLSMPKASKEVTVVVEVGNETILKNSMNIFISKLWDNFMEFWDKLLMAIFGAILFKVGLKINKQNQNPNKDEVKTQQPSKENDPPPPAQ